MSDITIYNYNIAPPDSKPTPLGQLYLLSVLRDNGFNADFKDLQLFSPRKENLLSFFENSSDMIGISCIFPFLSSVTFLIKELKKRYPEKMIILGGPGPTAVAEELLKITPADIIVRGEGEKTIVELMNCLERNKDLKNIRGISYRKDNKIYSNPPQFRIENLDQIPLPAYDKIDINEYSIISLITSRGCPYQCSFCYRNFLWGNKVVFRSIDNVIEELKLISEKNNKNEIIICDDIFTIDKNRVFDLCNKLKKEKIDIDWSCFGRVDLIDEQMMKKMSESGCKKVFYGIESGSDKILRKINKGFSVKMAENVLTKSKKYFPNVDASFIWGFPFETIEDFKKTIRMVEKARLESKISAYFRSLIPQIGTRIYDDYRDTLIPIPNFKNSLDAMSVDNLSKSPFFKTMDVLDKNRHIFEVFKNYPSIILHLYRFKTPHISKKLKILKDFQFGYEISLRIITKELEFIEGSFTDIP